MTGAAGQGGGGNPLAVARRVVVKIGSALLVDDETGMLRDDWLHTLVADIAALRRRGVDVVVVSSGAMALGREALGLPRGALSLEQGQAAAAVGQIRLARAWEEALAPHGILAAQLLLTLDDSQNRRRYLNSRATLRTLLALGAVPIVNENDTVATDEIRYGDNDRLSAQVAAMAGADVLVLLSDVDGLYTADPRRDPGARRLERIEAITPEIEAMAGESGSDFGSGGMRTKLMAARTAMRAGVAMAITHGGRPHPLLALERGEAPATWFLPAADPHAARKQWIAGMKPKGRIVVDDGAAKALARGSSLLPVGVKAIEGSFMRGDPVEIRTEGGALLGKGLVAYPAEDARRIMGRHSREIPALLGHPGRAALVHRDDMAL